MKISPEDYARAIDLSDAAARASLAGNHDLAKKLEAAATAFLEGSGPSFEEFAVMRNHNIERHEGKYISKHTQELHECWLAATGDTLA
ncbi:hypothetical protein [Pseudomonas viridiflava]|uniref:hypothetical protein n=1 Tax=Pseudomonas viridiflava TaxID=33069 RepID=UPI001C31282F|nr:hypothetical protein [Pseudomonas viridiflava]QXG42240.1 hypothetical protein KTT55_07015 [Pseudomonas viridiflava]